MPNKERFVITVAERGAEAAPPAAGIRPVAILPSEVNTEKFKDAYDNVLQAARYMCQRATGLVEGYSVEEIALHLGVSAEGGIWFVAKAGLEADIDVTIKRQPAT